MLSSLIFVLVSQASGNAPSTRSTTVTLPDLLPSEIHTTVALLRGQFKAVSSLLYYHYDTVHSNTSASLVRSACAKFIKFWGPFRAKYVVQFQKADSKLSNGSSTGQAPAQGSVLDRRMDAIQDLAVHLCLAINAGVDVARFGGSKYRGDAARAKADVREYILSDVDFYGKRDSLVCGIGCVSALHLFLCVHV